MPRQDIGEAGEIGDGAGDFDDSGVGACGQPQAVDDALQGGLAIGGEGTEALQELGGHFRVGEDAGAGEPFPLDFAGLLHPGGDGGGGLAFSSLDEGGGLDRMNPELQVYTNK